MCSVNRQQAWVCMWVLGPLTLRAYHVPSPSRGSQTINNHVLLMYLMLLTMYVAVVTYVGFPHYMYFTDA